MRARVILAAGQRIDRAVRAQRAASIIAIAAGVVFVIFGAGKFVDHAGELASFRDYGLPAPAFTVVAIGVLELVGGLLLALRRGVAPVAALMVGNMLTATAVSGIGKGEVLPSLTLAPVLLVAMVFLLTRARTADG